MRVTDDSLCVVILNVLSWVPYGLVDLHVYSLPCMLSLTGLNSSWISELEEELIVMRL